MPWYYVESGEQRGPVADADFDGLLQAGTVTDDTLVWREGLPSWQPWRDARPKPAGAAPTSGLLCAECGKPFQPDQVIRLNDRWVCAACKPVYLQRIREGTFTGSGATTGRVTEAQVRERDYEHDIGDYLNQGWQLFKSDVGGLLGATVLVGLCVFGSSLIPFGIGFMLSLILTGPLMVGLFAFYLKKIRNQPAAVGDAFGGFQRFGQALLGHLIPTLFTWLCFLPILIGAIFLGLTSAMLTPHAAGANAAAAVVPAMLMVIGVLFLAGFCVAIYLQICWIFTLWLIADKNMTFWPAMALSRAVVLKHWWQTLLLCIVGGALMVAGALACLVGIFVTGPVLLAMYGYAFERLFGDMEPAAD